MDWFFKSSARMTITVSMMTRHCRTAAKRIAPYGVNSNFQGGYVSLDQQCYEDEKGRTYRQLLGKEFKSETLIADPESGRVVEVIKLSEHGDALKTKGLRAERPTRGNDTERVRQQAARAETLFRERVFSAVRAKTPASITAGMICREPPSAYFDS